MSKKLNNSKRSQAKNGLFRQEFLPIPEEVRDWLLEKISICNEDGQQHALHNFDCSLDKIWEADGWVPNPRDFVQKFFPNSNMELLLDTGVMRKWWHSIAEHRCTRYAWDFDLLLEACDRMVTALMNPDCKLVNLYTGRKINSIRSTVTDESGNRVPEIVAIHIRSYSACCFNRTRTLRFFKEKKLELTRVKYQLGQDHPEYEYLAQCYMACCSSFRAVVACNPVHLGGDLGIYNPPYKTQGSGRLTHIGGGPQNAIFEMQCAMFADIPNYRNYDMVSSQPNGVIQWLGEANLDPSWLVEYRDTHKAKHVYSDRAGMNLDTPEVNTACWKDCLNSVLMGTPVIEPGLNKEGKDNILSCFVAIVEGSISENKVGALFKYILKYCKNNPFKATKVYKQFYKLIKPLVAVLEEWHEWLLKVYVPQNQKVSKSGSYIVGACGTKLYLDDLKTQEKKSKVAAFLLQSNEARYIAEIAKLAPQHGYRMKQNYHDGFICEGEVPIEAQQAAALASGLLNARLDEKPFTNPYAQQEQQELEKAREINLRELYTGRAIEDLTPEEQAAIQYREELEQLAEKWGITEPAIFESTAEDDSEPAEEIFEEVAEPIVETTSNVESELPSGIPSWVKVGSHVIYENRMDKVYRIWQVKSHPHPDKVKIYFDQDHPIFWSCDVKKFAHVEDHLVSFFNRELAKVAA